MKGTLIAFTVQTGKDKTKSSAFIKAFYGQNSSSHHGKYQYHRKGLLDDILHCKLIRGVIIVRKNDAEEVIQFLEHHSAVYYVRIVELAKEDKRILDL